MRLTDHTMWALLVSLCVLCTVGTYSQTLRERSLTPESAVLVQSFRKYLAGVERQRRDDLERTGRAASNSTFDPTCSLLCTDRKDCGNIIQNFGLYLDPKSALRMCKAGPKKILVQSNYDTSPYCQYLQSHFNICENKTAVMEIGCQFTCEKCKVCDDDECKCSKHSTGRYIDGRYVCKCNKGFRGDGFTCLNINECRENTHDCHRTRANCTDLTPFWKCSCKVGYSGDGKTCTDVNECTTRAFPKGKECDAYADCTNTIGSYYCTCKPGFSGDGYFCKDVDECARGIDTCARRGSTRIATCTNTFGNYTCACNEGYKDVGSLKDGRVCADIDECKEGTDNCDKKNGKCSNTIGSFTCTCNEGYEGDGVRCRWKNPCDLGTHDCSENARCVSLPNDKYTCQCLEGFKDNIPGTSRPGRDCRNIDECKERTHGCDKSILRATCTDTIGSYKCSCNVGWVGNGSPNCADKNECHDGSHKCIGRSSCVNTQGSYRCTCPSGYKLTMDQRNCEDNDECKSKTDNCHQWATCKNTDGSYTCTCNTGYEGTGITCSDIDECKRGTDICSPREYCTNTVGSYNCTCRSGFTRVDTRCEDVDECKLGTDSCNKTYTLCKNTVGSYSCTCKTGFEPFGSGCRDINECNRNVHECSESATCRNSWGSYTCSCNIGFEGNGRTCTDINECVRGTHNCPRPNLGICTNTRGSFRCSCVSGYELKGSQCEDIDECKRGTHKCMAHSSCKNTPGSYTCLCNNGYKMENGKCVDIDECKNGTHTCCKKAGYATCTNTPGSFSCKCNRGFEGNGHVCADINECERGTHKCDRHATCSNTIGSFTCKCNTGFTGNGLTCKDIDECKANTHKCHQLYGICTNTIGSYECRCKPGFRGDGRNCRDINECMENTHDCHRPHAMCYNTIGSFECSCKPGFTESQQGRVCEDIDECRKNTHNCHRPHAKCDNTIGSFVCSCKTGYRGDGYTCTAIKHCAEGTDKCSKYATCTDLSIGGTYRCDCFFGFFGNGNTCTGSRGKSFLVLFMQNIDVPTETAPKPRRAEIYIASVKKTDVKVSSSKALSTKLKSTIDQTISMNPNSVKTVTVSHEIRVNESVVEDKAIILETSDVTSVFALNHDGHTSDSTLVLPIDRLGTEYVISSTEPHNNRESDYNSQIALAAVEDRTRVEIKLKLPRGQTIEYKGKHQDGSTIIVNLNKYQTFQLSHNGDLTGTMITSSKPVAVFSGNRCNKLNRYGYCSHLVEQMPPVDSLDTIYVIPQHVNRTGTLIRVLSVNAGSTAFSYTADTSTTSKTLGTYGNFDIKVSGKQAVVVEAKRKVLVVSYSLAARWSKSGDPYMTMVPGVHQYVHQYHVAVPQGFEDNHFAIIVKKNSKSNLRLNNDSISPKDVVSETSVTVKNVAYIVLTVKVRPGVYRVETTDLSRFGLMIYGHGHDDGYGFAANILGPGKI